MPKPFAASLLFLLAATAPCQDRQQFDIVQFDLPDGWTRREADGRLLLENADKSARIECARSTPLEGAVEAKVAALKETAGKLADYRIETEAVGGYHASSKGQWRYFAYSHGDPDKAGSFVYHGVIVLAAGGRCSTFELVAGAVAAFDANRTTFSALANKAQLTSSIRLERGTPPLTRYMMDEATAFVEWLLQSPLTEEQKATVETEVRGYWKQKVQEEIDGVVELLAARTQLAALGEAERELARGAAADVAITEWRKQSDNACARLMLAIYDAAHQPLAAGEPPLTRQAVEAYAEFLNFAAGKTVGLDEKLPKESRDKLFSALVANYPTLAKEQRETIAGMPMVWAALRVVWPQYDEGKQQQYIAAWKQNPVIAGLGKALADEASLRSMRDLQSRQLQMQTMQNYWSMMSNVMTMTNNTQRIMMSNLGGNTRYEYRW